MIEIVVELAGNVWTLGVWAWLLWVVTRLTVERWLPAAITDDAPADREAA